MEDLGLFIASLSLASTSAVASEITFVLDLYHLAGNLTAQQQSELIASTQWEIVGYYSPTVSIPGVTSSLVARCGFLQMPCIKEDIASVNVPKAEIHHEGNHLRFTLPKRVSWRRFRLDSIDLRLPVDNINRINKLETRIWVLEKGEGAAMRPIGFEGDGFVIGGSVSIEGDMSLGRVDTPQALEHSRERPTQDGYEFMPMHRYAMSHQGYLFPGETLALPEPLPPELQGLKIFRAYMKSLRDDQHLIEYVDISATQERPDCSSDYLQYDIVFVDGMPVRYMSTNPDEDDKQCRGHYLGVEWDNDNRVMAFNGMTVDYINGGSSVTYDRWHAFCLERATGSMDDCNGAGPSDEQIARVLENARKVRQWFIKDSAGQGATE